MKKIEDYIEELFVEAPELKNIEKGIKMYFTAFFKHLELETKKGYSVNAGNWMYYTFRTSKEQEKWECSHKKKIYKKLELWKKTTL